MIDYKIWFDFLYLLFLICRQKLKEESHKRESTRQCWVVWHCNTKLGFFFLPSSWVPLSLLIDMDVCMNVSVSSECQQEELSTLDDFFPSHNTVSLIIFIILALFIDSFFPYYIFLFLTLFLIKILYPVSSFQVLPYPPFDFTIFYTHLYICMFIFCQYLMFVKSVALMCICI